MRDIEIHNSTEDTSRLIGCQNRPLLVVFDQIVIMIKKELFIIHMKTFMRINM